MMPFALDIKLPLLSKLSAVTLSIVIGSSSLSYAEIDIGTLGSQSTMAEQGAICASFSALMENQVLINQNLGDLWSERRKFSGAVIRRAVELAGLESPSSEDIDLLINDYREWLLLNLSTNDDAVASSQYQSDIQNIIRTNCASLYVQADKAILRRFPKLAYLINENNEKNATDSAEMSALLNKNKELSGKIISLTAKIASLENEAEKKAENIVLSAPEPRPTPPKNKQTTTDLKPENKSQDKRFFAQLGSFTSESKAKAALADMKTNFQSLFNGTAISITPHEFASGEVFYRVRTEVAERTKITKICDKLWQSRMGCLIKTNID